VSNSYSKAEPSSFLLFFIVFFSFFFFIFFFEKESEKDGESRTRSERPALLQGRGEQSRAAA
jgi:hypothetical protein